MMNTSCVGGLIYVRMYCGSTKFSERERANKEAGGKEKEMPYLAEAEHQQILLVLLRQRQVPRKCSSEMSLLCQKLE